MTTYKVVFKSGAKETVEAASMEINEVLDKVEVKDENGDEMEHVYLDMEDISAIIPERQ